MNRNQEKDPDGENMCVAVITWVRYVGWKRLSIKILNSISDDLPSDLRKIIDDHKSRFEGIGQMNDAFVKLDINPDVKPVAEKHRRIPSHLREKVEMDVNRLMSVGIIETVTELNGWISPVVLTNKSDCVST